LIWKLIKTRRVIYTSLALALILAEGLKMRERRNISYNTAQKEYCGHYGVTNMLDIIGKRQYKTTVNEGIISLMPTLDSEMKRINSKIEDYLKTNLPQKEKS